MTRREEIMQQAEMFRQPYKGSGNYSTSIDIKNAFQEGAEWADKTMIEKSIQWMKEQVYQEYGGGPLERLIPDTRIEEFRKAMEE